MYDHLSWFIYLPGHAEQVAETLWHFGQHQQCGQSACGWWHQMDPASLLVGSDPARPGEQDQELSKHPQDIFSNNPQRDF